MVLVFHLSHNGCLVDGAVHFHDRAVFNIILNHYIINALVSLRLHLGPPGLKRTLVAIMDLVAAAQLLLLFMNVDVLLFQSKILHAIVNSVEFVG